MTPSEVAASPTRRPAQTPAQRATAERPEPLRKAATGISGLDEITQGGLPHGRATLVTGGAGSGKTLFGVEFLVRGALEYGEAGVLIAFEEAARDLATNVASLGFDLPQLERDNLLVVDAIALDPTTFVTTGAYDLEALFIRIAAAVDAVGAQRVVLDTIEVLFSAFGDSSVVRSELNRLLRWLKERGLTVVLTGEHGDGGRLTRYGIEEYVSDCVITLDNRTIGDVATRRLRLIKYRGSTHGSNEYPFLITDRGFVVLPLTALRLEYGAFTERISTGVPRLDHMLNGGVYRGSTTLISGGAGSGKSTLAAHAAVAACERGERCLFLSFEESPDQLIRNQRSVGLDLGRWVDEGLLALRSSRPTAMGLEGHVAELYRLLEESDPTLVVVDAIGALAGTVPDENGARSAMMRQVDLLKSRGITGIFTTLLPNVGVGSSAAGISSIVDTWLMLRNQETGGERNRLLVVVKSRGSAHSNQVREFVITDRGAELIDVYIGPDEVLTGSARVSRLAEMRAAEQAHEFELASRRRERTRRVAAMERQVTALREDLDAERQELETLEAADRTAMSAAAAGRADMAAVRQADTMPASAPASPAPSGAPEGSDR